MNNTRSDTMSIQGDPVKSIVNSLTAPCDEGAQAVALSASRMRLNQSTASIIHDGASPLESILKIEASVLRMFKRSGITPHELL